MLHRLFENKKIRFLCVGTFNTLLDLSILNFLVFVVHLPVWLSNIISVSISYFLNHMFVFRHHKSPNIKLFLKFFAITASGIIVIQTLVIYLTRPIYFKVLNNVFSTFTLSLDNRLSLNMAKLTAVLIGMSWNYILYSKLVFKKTIEQVEKLDT